MLVNWKRGARKLSDDEVIEMRQPAASVATLAQAA
jgi:hypothetical protein